MIFKSKLWRLTKIIRISLDHNLSNAKQTKGLSGLPYIRKFRRLMIVTIARVVYGNMNTRDHVSNNSSWAIPNKKIYASYNWSIDEHKRSEKEE